ncbi:MAG: glycosyltransferase family 39 protein [Patescibacteria group bacterium]|nr:glycosyltransferase family 39 protein [Patescibacteria group bacterium]
MLGLGKFAKLPLRRKAIFLYLFILLVIGGVLRFFNLNWDQGHFFHPDERNIALAVTRIEFFSNLNPEFFAYGSFPIYIYRAIADILVFLTGSSLWISQWPYINFIGRNVSAFFSVLTILFVFVLVKKIFSEKMALLSAFFITFCPFLIQLAHFSITESLLVFQLLIILIFCLRIISKKTKTTDFLFLGIVLGLALSTKTAALSFLIIPFLSIIFKRPKLKELILLAFSTVLVFLIFSPFIILDYQSFLESMRYEGGVVSGILKVPYTYQFEKTHIYLFQIKNFFWQMGPVAGMGILGFLSLLALAIKKKDKKLILFLSFPFCYFLYVGAWHTKFIRYMAPLLPFLAICASWLLLKIKEKYKILGYFLIGFFLAITIIWGLAFSFIYAKEQTRITASKWIYGNILKGSIILQEHWDDGLPVDFEDHHPSEYILSQLTIYDTDSEEKIKALSSSLERGDYLVISSRRLYGTLINLPEIYPLTSRYYKLLFAEKLGFRLEQEFTSYPKIFGWEIRDDKSEETFQVYDHPKVMIFKNNERFLKEKIANLIKE